MPLVGFVAYPASVNMIVDTIRGATQQCDNPRLTTWEELDVPGRFISSEIVNKIDQCDLLIADISRLNFNVTYEIGYAIGKGKRVLLIKNRAVHVAAPSVNDVGIFDTIGYKEYSTSAELSNYLKNSCDARPIHVTETRNEKSPIYLVQPKTKTDYDGMIVSDVKKSRLYFRSFDASEASRLAGPEAVHNVAESYGVVLHFLPEEHVDAPIHNMRSAFVAGLADGMGKRRVYIQTGETPVPIDYRDFVTQCRFPNEFKEAITELAERVYDDRSSTNILSTIVEGSLIETINLGASAAENEITTLGEYYLEIDAYRRAIRKEVRLVTGRKGSGKTAIFFIVRDQVRQHRQNVVVDLKPEGYQLMKLKDAVTGLLSTGTVEHTITAFWEYLLWLEVCYKLLEKDQELHKRDHRLFEPYQKLKANYLSDTYSSKGDFAERLKALLRDIVSTVNERYSGQSAIELSTPEITELVYRHNFLSLKDKIINYLGFKNELWLLFDNIDKGWATHGVNPEDLVILRSLMEATRKIERDLTKQNVEAHTLVFLRNDVFEHLVDETSDRGKETRANVDWSDSDLLKEMLRRRLVRALPEDKQDTTFTDLWSHLCVPLVDGEDSAEYLIKRSLMRPRSLLDLIGHCRGYAINLGHNKIEKEDIAKGCDAFSNDLLSELDLEIRDVFPSAEHLLYAFIGAKHHLTRTELETILKDHGIFNEQLQEVIRILLWFGFIGMVWTDSSDRYIYSFNYNIKGMDSSHNQLLNKGTIRYSINPAFTPALGLQKA